MRHVFLTSRLDADHGGLTASLLRKAGILQRQLGWRPVIATFHDAVEFPQVAAVTRDRYQLPPEVSLINVNHVYRGRPAPPDAPADALERLCADLPDRQIRWTHDADRVPCAATVTVGGKAVRRVWVRPDGSVFQFRNLTPGGRPGPAPAAPAGAPDRTAPDRTPGAGAPDRTAPAGSPGANGPASPGGSQPGRERPEAAAGAQPAGPPYPDSEVVLDPLTAAERRFKTMDGFRRHFMAELSRGELTYLVCEARLLDRALLGLESRHARKVFVFHSTHLRPGSNVVRTGNRAVLKNLSQADALVVLTPQQRDHIVDRFGFADRVRVIPHSVKAQSATGERTPGLVVVVARLSPEKNVGAAIRAFAKVRRARPDARLEIWGHGEEEPALKGLAEDLGLGEAVRFAGYAPGAAAAFARAECSLLTSRWEGLGLTVMESMAVGTPCVAYDLDYGPAALIEDGVSGSLVPQGDEDALAGRLLVLLNASPADKQAMSKAAADRMADFSQERLAARWSELFDSLRHPVATRPPLVKRLWRRIPDGPRERLGALLGL